MVSVYDYYSPLPHLAVIACTEIPHVRIEGAIKCIGQHRHKITISHSENYCHKKIIVILTQFVR
jgi:hypothetical protein